MTDNLTGEELEQLYYSKKLDLSTLPAEDLIVLSDYLGESELNDKQTALLEECLRQLSTFDDYKLVTDPQTNQKTWDRVIEKYEQTNTHQPKKIYRFKKIFISVIAASLSLFGISAIVCCANGTSILNLFYDKQKCIVTNNNEAEINMINTDYTDYEKFITDNSEAVVPNYIPEGYKFTSANAYVDNEQKQYIIIFENEKYSLKFKQVEYLSNNQSLSLQSETNGESIEQYSINGITWSIYSNNNKNIAISIIDNVQYSINTYENIDELKKITDFIYEKEKKE